MAVYLDHAATSPMPQEVLDAYVDALIADYQAGQLAQLGEQQP